MGLDIWFREDIRNALLAADKASMSAVLALSVNGTETRHFVAGYKAALATIAIAFGLSPQIFFEKEKQGASHQNSSRLGLTE